MQRVAPACHNRGTERIPAIDFEANLLLNCGVELVSQNSIESSHLAAEKRNRTSLLLKHSIFLSNPNSHRGKCDEALPFYDTGRDMMRSGDVRPIEGGSRREYCPSPIAMRPSDIR
jgi:hypothetical protein